MVRRPGGMSALSLGDAFLASSTTTSDLSATLHYCWFHRYGAYLGIRAVAAPVGSVGHGCGVGYVAVGDLCSIRSRAVDRGGRRHFLWPSPRSTSTFMLGSSCDRWPGRNVATRPRDAPRDSDRGCSRNSRHLCIVAMVYFRRATSIFGW